ncbi:MAG: NAD-binding protein, partial [Methanoregulaceae archaeon]|nr:NAD-binding protein [Methanoregulaceae archaeon]
PLNPELEECRRLGAFIIEGDATREYFLKRANILKARYLYCVAGEDDLNARIALTAKKVHETGNSDTLTCFLHIVDPRLTNLLKIGQMTAGSNSNVEFEFINIYQNAGRCLIDTLPFYKDDISPPAHRVHLLILHLGRMGETMLVHAVQKWREHHYLEKTGNRIKISFIDPDAERKFRILQTRYPALEHYCELIPLQMELESAEFLAGTYLLDNSHRCDATYIFICSENSSVGFSAAMTLSDLLNRIRDRCPHVLGDYQVPVWIRTMDERGFSELFNDLATKSPEYRNIRVFPLVSCSCCVDSILFGAAEQLARAIHERYLENRYRGGEQPGSRPALQPWASLPEEMKKKNRRQAGSIFSCLIREGFAIVMHTDWDEPVFEFSDGGADDEIDRLARLEHENWSRSEQKSGPKKEPHRCLRDWNDPELPRECRERTREAIRTWPELLAMIDMKIIRLHKI